ncbi:hypothetical protein BC332_29729 [Capsicum chinense]|nr:hypothetical protein BC332_29729 [Capsicum chinense]
MHRSWVNGLQPPPFPVDNPEYLSSLPSVSYTQFTIFVDTPQHASGPAPGQHYPKTSNIHFFTPQHKSTTCSAPPTVHVFVVPSPPEALTFEVDITATAEEHNMTIDNPSTTSKDEEKVEPVILGERKIYLFEGFNISDEAPKKLTQLINDYSEWIVDGLLKHHTGSSQKFFETRNECLINIIKGFSIPVVLLWHLVDEVYIPINCGDEFHWVLVVVVLKERRIQVYDSMSRRRCFGPSSEIQKLAKILPTYLDMSGFLDQKIRTDWSTIEAYRDKMANPFDVQHVDGISQQTIGILDCSPFVAAYAEYLSNKLQSPNDGLDAGLLRKRYAALLWKYGEAKAQKPYATDVKDPR